MEIYRTQGYTDRDAVSAIVENNLYGLDIDDRAAQLAYFALMMKACEHDRRFLRRGIQPHVCAITEWSGSQTDEPAWSDAERRAAHMLRETFRDAKEFGSILSIPKPLADALNELGENPFAGEATLGVDTENLRKLAAQAKIMAQKYDVVVTNPPYMGSSGMGAKLAEFVKKQYPDSKSDLFAVFMERGREYTKIGGYCCMVTMQSWMFLSSFEKLRGTIMKNQTITTLMHMENMVLGIAFGTAVSVLKNEHIAGYKGTYNHIKLEDIEDGEPKDFPIKGNRFAQVSSDNFEKIPGAPVAYWVSEKMMEAFEKGVLLGTVADARQGLATADNNRFLREWYEIDVDRIMFHAKSCEEAKESGKKWFPYNKGGEFRKWYGNNDFVVNWENDGYEIKHFADEKGKIRSYTRNPQYYFRECLSWSLVSSSVAAFRYKPNGNIFDVAGMSCFSDENLLYLLSLCNTNIAMEILSIIAPTINYQCGDIANIPVIDSVANREFIEEKTKENIDVSKTDWDSFETSWDFKKHPLI